MLARPAVRKILEREKNVLVTAPVVTAPVVTARVVTAPAA